VGLGSCDSPQAGHLSDGHRLFIDPTEPGDFKTKIDPSRAIVRQREPTCTQCEILHKHRAGRTSTPVLSRARPCGLDGFQLTALLTPRCCTIVVQLVERVSPQVRPTLHVAPQGFVGIVVGDVLLLPARRDTNPEFSQSQPVRREQCKQCKWQ
jgi:hypothetical protein